MLALTKALQEITENAGLNLMFSLSDELMYHAWRFERGGIPHQNPTSQISVEIELLNEMDRVLTKLRGLHI